MSDKQHAQLVLRGCDLLVANSTAGSVSTGNLNFTWTNINLRTVLGPLYDKYDEFYLTLKYIATGANPKSFLTADNCNLLLNISGLPFLNQTYNQPRNCNGTTAIVGAYLFPTAINNASSQCFYSSNYLIFGKNQELVNINIYYTRVVDCAVPVYDAQNCTYAPPVFILDIFGIDKEEGNKNGMRL